MDLVLREAMDHALRGGRVTIKDLREQLKQAAADCVRLQAEIVEGERNCRHSWSGVERDPVAGLDRWRRDCLLCGRIEYTTITRPGPPIPVFARSCPCWATGVYVWVEGCEGHPRESAT